MNTIFSCRNEERKKGKAKQAEIKKIKHSHINQGKVGTLVSGTVKFRYHKGKKENQWGSGGLQA
jgi:hypothetical protein